MKKIKFSGLLFIAILFFINVQAQEKTFVMQDANQQCMYNMVDGRMTGDFASYYENGQMQAKGILINGYRAGLWTVWDTSGIKRVERSYKNIFEFDRVFPTVPQEGPIPLLIQNAHTLAYNTEGIIEYAKIKNENILSRHKFWRTIEPKNNEYLFKDDLLFNTIKKLALTGKVVLFDTIDDRFTQLIKKELYASIFQKTNGKIVRFEIKEEATFDLDNMIMEKRVIGICPIVKIGKEEKQLFWVYYPDMRKYFGKEIISASEINDIRIKSLDNFFIFRNFTSTLIKTTIDNPFDKFFKNYYGVEGNEKAILALAEEIELRIIVNEHYHWLSLTK
jgi:hypothetical protein